MCGYLWKTGKSRLKLMGELLTEVVNTPMSRMTKEQAKIYTALLSAEAELDRRLKIPVDTRDPVLHLTMRKCCPFQEPEEEGEHEQNTEWLLNGDIVPKARKKREYQYVPPAPEEELERLYRMGLNDRQIADKVGCRDYHIKRWRARKGCQSNAHTVKKRDDSVMMQLYEEGHGDPYIAKRFNMTRGAVYSWRKRNGLPANHKQGMNEKPAKKKKRDDVQLMKLYEYGLGDQELAELTGVSKETVRRWRRDNGLPPNRVKERKRKTDGGES